MSRTLPPWDGLAVAHWSMRYPAAAATSCRLARAENSPRRRRGSMRQRPLAVGEQCFVSLGGILLHSAARQRRTDSSCIFWVVSRRMDLCTAVRRSAGWWRRCRFDSTHRCNLCCPSRDRILFRCRGKCNRSWWHSLWRNLVRLVMA